MATPRTWPVALTIAGSDSGGGAGIQADLKTFSALKVHGTTAITCVTAQNPRAVSAIQPCRPAIVRAQIEAVLMELKPNAIKTGMLYDRGVIQAVAEAIPWRTCSVVVDPVMVATSGARLLRPSAIQAFMELILPRASLVTPNLDETEILLGQRVRTVPELREAARALQGRFGAAFLAKGGHLPGKREAVDIFYDGRVERILRAPYVLGVSTHGTGCTYSAAIAAYCARGVALPRAVGMAKEYITKAICKTVYVRRHSVLGWSS